MSKLFNYNKVFITSNDFNTLNTLLEYEELPEDQKDQGFVKGFEFKFLNNHTITFDIHLGGHNAYDNVILRNDDNIELWIFDCAFKVDEVMEFTYEDYLGREIVYVCCFKITDNY